MTSIFHTELESRWNSFPLIFQLANIGAEVEEQLIGLKKGIRKWLKTPFIGA